MDNTSELQPAKIAYQAYRQQAVGKTFDGKLLPSFEELGTERQACWVAAAEALAQPEQEPLTHDLNHINRLTHTKTKGITEQHKYNITGFVLTNGDGKKCISDMAAVRWFENEDFFAMMHSTPPAQPAQQAQWQPIDTAPKDGTVIWLATPYQYRFGSWHRNTWFDQFTFEETDKPDPSLYFRPTHWMPIPELPTDITKGGEA